MNKYRISENRLGYPLGYGICATAYDDNENYNTVIIETSRYEKYLYWRELGIVWEKPTIFYDIEYLGTRKRMYRLVVTRLEKIDETDLNKIYAEYNEMKTVSDHDINKLYAHRHEFPIHRPIIEFVYKHQHSINWVFDCHAGNYLKCPVTGMIIPHDALNFNRKGKDLFAS